MQFGHLVVGAAELPVVPPAVPGSGPGKGIEERRGGVWFLETEREREMGIERAWVGVRLSMSVNLEGYFSFGFAVPQASNKGFLVLQ